jgi:hypothetical protein
MRALRGSGASSIQIRNFRQRGIVVSARPDQKVAARSS